MTDQPRVDLHEWIPYVRSHPLDRITIDPVYIHKVEQSLKFD